MKRKVYASKYGIAKPELARIGCSQNSYMCLNNTFNAEFKIDKHKYNENTVTGIYEALYHDKWYKDFIST